MAPVVNTRIRRPALRAALTPSTTAIITARLTPGFTTAGSIEIPHRVAQRLDLALIGGLLHFGEFQCLENFIHRIERFAQRNDDSVHFIDRLGDRGGRGRLEITARLARRWRRLRAILGGFPASFTGIRLVAFRLRRQITIVKFAGLFLGLTTGRVGSKSFFAGRKCFHSLCLRRIHVSFWAVFPDWCGRGWSGRTLWWASASPASAT
jgi:hypothetical protein